MIKLLIISMVIVLVSHSVMAMLDKTEFSETLLKLADMLHTVCVHQSGTDEAAIKEVQLGNFKDDVKIKKYIKCLWIESSAMNEDGSINMDMIALLSPPILKQKLLISTPLCDAKSAGLTPLYEKTYAIMKCFYERNPSQFFVV